MTIREYREQDREVLKEITAICFEGVSIDQNIQKIAGLINGKDWTWRKKRHIDADIAADPAGVFVAEADGRCIGYVTTRVDRATKVGSIPNLAVLPEHRKGGIGRKLMDTAVARLKTEGMECVRIETLDQNAVGRHFYPAYGFTEVARQLHYFKKIAGA